MPLFIVKLQEKDMEQFFKYRNTFCLGVCSRREHTLGNADMMTKSADFGVIQTWIQILTLSLMAV